MSHKVAKTFLTIAATLSCAVAVATPKIYCPQVFNPMHGNTIKTSSGNWHVKLLGATPVQPIVGPLTFHYVYDETDFNYVMCNYDNADGTPSDVVLYNDGTGSPIPQPDFKDGQWTEAPDHQAAACGNKTAAGKKTADQCPMLADT